MTLLLLMNLDFAMGAATTPPPATADRGRTRRRMILGNLFGGR